MQETMHLLRSPKNAARLMESIAQLRAGKAKPRRLKSAGKTVSTAQVSRKRSGET